MALVGQARLAGKPVTVEFVTANRSDAQNSALHLWLERVAEFLNQAGMDMRHIIKEEVSIDWSKESCKEYLWRPIQRVVTGQESTTRPSKTQYSEIHETLTRHFAEKFGVVLPDWPHRE